MILEHLTQITAFIVEGLIDLWPWLLFSIPLAVMIRVTDSSRHIRRVFVSQPVIAILLATLVGAFSPFCACTVIPLITSLLVAGVPLGPVMAFWIASPTMDPEIFVLSVGLLGPELAVIRVVATLILSISAGLLAHYLEQRSFFRGGILRERKQAVDWSWRRMAVSGLNRLRGRVSANPELAFNVAAFTSLDAVPLATVPAETVSASGATCDTGTETTTCGDSCSTNVCSSDVDSSQSLGTRVRQETIDTTVMILKFMVIALVLEALITFYVPQDAIVGLLGAHNPLAILLAALVGIPVYTTNLTALPLVSALLQQGMMPGAALTFLIAGPVTTIPAMSAVYGIAKPRVFAVYVAVALVGAMLLGYGYQLLLG